MILTMWTHNKTWEVTITNLVNLNQTILNREISLGLFHVCDTVFTPYIAIIDVCILGNTCQVDHHARS